jgi:hypothetical protein
VINSKVYCNRHCIMNSYRKSREDLSVKCQKPSPAGEGRVRRFKIKHFSLTQIIRFRLLLSGSMKSMCSNFPSPNPLPLERAFFSGGKSK